MSDHNVVSLNAWRDFNDASPQVDPFDVEPDAEQIAIFLDLVFGYCDGWVPLRGFIDKGQGIDGRPHNAWRGWDSNPRYSCPYSGFRDRPIRPLWHLSADEWERGFYRRSALGARAGARRRFRVGLRPVVMRP